MRTTALLLVLVSRLALADDAPRMVRVMPGHTTPEAAWLLNDSGKAKLDAHIQAEAERAARLELENQQLRDVPALTWGGVFLLIGVGLVAGAAAAVPLTLALRR